MTDSEESYQRDLASERVINYKFIIQNSYSMNTFNYVKCFKTTG